MQGVINNVAGLRGHLLETLNNLNSGKVSAALAKEHANIGGKIIASAKIELDYNKVMKYNRKIEFLEVPEKEKK